MMKSKKNVKIAIINPPSLAVDDDRVEPHLGTLYIASALRECNFDNVVVFDMSGSPDEEEIEAKMKAIPFAHVYGITSMCTHIEYTARIVRQARILNPTAYIVMGGPNPTGVPKITLKYCKPDVVVTGEGEEAFIQCVRSFTEGRPLKGIIPGKHLPDIDLYPFPARDLVDLSSYSRRLVGEPTVSLISSRGCAFHCVHCNSVVMGGGSRGVRYRSVKNVLAEVEDLCNHGFRYFRFNDDHMTGNPHLVDLLSALKPLQIKFMAFVRIADLTRETCQLLHEAGCLHVNAGIESLNPDNLRFIGKGAQAGTESNVGIARDCGITVRASFIVGLPYDSDETIEKHFRKATKLGLSEYEIYSLIPYPGTRLWNDPESLGYTITDKTISNYIQMGKNGKTCYVLRHKNFSPEDVKRWHQMATQILESGNVKHMRESLIATVNQPKGHYCDQFKVQKSFN
jgi:anaerobic magnesium-protoporphyrin IX monomethyl ester cyclase